MPSVIYNEVKSLYPSSIACYSMLTDHWRYHARTVMASMPSMNEGMEEVAWNEHAELRD